MQFKFPEDEAYTYKSRYEIWRENADFRGAIQTQQGSDAMCWWGEGIESIRRNWAHSFIEENHNKNVESKRAMLRESSAKTCRCRAIIFELDCFVAL